MSSTESLAHLGFDWSAHRETLVNLKGNVDIERQTMLPDRCSISIPDAQEYDQKMSPRYQFVEYLNPVTVP